jgi:hypothetical protein
MWTYDKKISLVKGNFSTHPIKIYFCESEINYFHSGRLKNQTYVCIFRGTKNVEHFHAN